MKGTDIAILGGVAVIGYGLLNSNFFKGVGGGVGDAVGGLGEGIGSAGQAAGYNLGEVFNAVGQLGRSSELIIREGGLQSREVIREGGQLVSETVHELGQDVPQIVDYVGDVPRDIAGAASTATGSLREVNKGFWEGFNKTWNLNEPTNIFTNTARGVGGVFSWVKKQVSPKRSLREDTSTASIMTGAVVSSSPQSPTTTSSSTTGGGGSGSIRTTTSRNTFMESLGYQGTSTPTGVVYSKPTPTFFGKPYVAPVVEKSIRKPWYKFW